MQIDWYDFTPQHDISQENVKNKRSKILTQKYTTRSTCEAVVREGKLRFIPQEAMSVVFKSLEAVLVDVI